MAESSYMATPSGPLNSFKPGYFEFISRKMCCTNLVSRTEFFIFLYMDKY